MGSIQDVINLIRKGPEMLSKANSVKLNRKSVVSGAKDATFQFPCLISDTNPIDMANATVQTLDRVYAEYTKTWLSVNAMYDITLDPTPTSYLRKLHQNTRFESTMLCEEDMGYIVEGVYNGDLQAYSNADHSYLVVFNKADKGLYKVMEENAKLMGDGLKELGLEEVTEADVETFTDVAASLVDSTARKAERERRTSALKDSSMQSHPVLDNRDVKKANDLMPYAIQVRLVAVNDKKEFVQFMDIIVGVKTYMHSIKSEEMIENLGRAVQNKSLLFKTLRWTTGELSFVKDLLLNIHDIRQDALTRQSNNPYFIKLKKLRNQHLTLRNVTVPTKLIPNATIIISRIEADALRDRYAIDVMDPMIAKRLIESLFLMAFVVIEEGVDVVYIMYDHSTDFEEYSVDALQRENRINRNSMDKMIGQMVMR